MTLRRLHDGRVLLDSGSRWEPLMGYSRAVRAGDRIHVAGCVGIGADGRYPEGMEAQTRRCLERIAEALAPFGVGLDAIVQVRIYTTRIASWEAIAAVMGPAFAQTRPANVLVEVAALVDPAALVEIEAEAWLRAGGGEETRRRGGDR